MDTLRRIYRRLPSPSQRLARKLWGILADSPFSSQHQRQKWIRDVYTAFGRNERQRIFLSIARFLHINRPISGYYFEFGCNEANTMRMAWDAFHHLFDLTYVGFDSFEGLPEIDDIDKQEIWEKGKLAYAEQEFIKTVTRHGMPKDKLVTVRGFYDAVLTEQLKSQFLPGKAAMIYVDCDLYRSTVPVLAWIVDFLQRGTVVVFDDWNCFCGDPDLGERRAWREFQGQHPTLRFQEFVSTNEAQAFVFLGPRD